MRSTTLVALLTGVMLYLVMGALVFSTLETPDERLAYEDLLDTKRTFLNKSCVTELDFDNLVKVPHEANSRHINTHTDCVNFKAMVCKYNMVLSGGLECCDSCKTVEYTAGLKHRREHKMFGQVYL